MSNVLLSHIYQLLAVTASNLEMMANLAIIYFTFKYFRDNQYIKLEFSCGTIKIQRKNINPSNLTNIISKEFYGGDRIPPEVRKEIISITNPKYKVC